MTSLFLLAFGISLAYCAPPGPVTAEALRRGLMRGFRPALLLELGSLIGDATWAAIALAGVTILIQSTVVRVALGLIGAAFLLHLAWSAYRDARAGGAPKSALPGGRGDFATGALVSLGNPNAVAFWLGIGGAMVAGVAADPGPGQFAVFFAGFLSAALGWCFFIATLIAWGGRLMSAAFFRWVNVACALTLGYFGLRLLVATLRLL
jgi:chemosensory pili system protein ChpE